MIARSPVAGALTQEQGIVLTASTGSATDARQSREAVRIAGLADAIALLVARLSPAGNLASHCSD
jgi:hypothetical protein